MMFIILTMVIFYLLFATALNIYSTKRYKKKNQKLINNIKDHEQRNK